MVVRSTRVVLPEGVAPASIHIERGRITHVGAYDDRGAKTSAKRFDAIDVGDLAVSPGIVDTHVHVNEPGRSEWEGFDTATRAAAAGGVTTIVDMPLNSIPATTTVDALDAKRGAARGHVHVDVAFWGGVVPGNTGELDALVDAGVRGFKCFLVPSGVDEFPHVGESDLRQALPILARRGVPLLVHAESPAALERSEALHASDVARYAHYLATRPPAAETDAVRMMIRLAREFNARVHIVHVACAEAAAEIAHAKGEGVAMTAETCPHYLTFAAEEIRDGATEFEGAPPIRDAHHPDALVTALARRSGTQLIRWIAPSYLAAGIAYATLGLAPTIWVAALTVVVAHTFGSILWVASNVLLQMSVPDTFRGRVFAAELMVMAVVQSTFTFATAVALDRFHASPRLLAIVIGLCLCGPAIWWWRTTSGVVLRRT